MAGPRGYSRYRGKGSKAKIALAVFLVLVILGSVLVIRLQEYIVYDDSGKPHLELPQTESTLVKPVPDQSGASSSFAEPNLTVQVPEKTTVQAFELPVGALADWSATWQDITAQGVTYNAAVYTVKDTGGYVYLDSQAAPVHARKTNEGSGMAIAAMLNQEGLYAVAKLSCFRDGVASGDDLDGKGLKNTGGYIFYDGNNDRWLDPAKPAARQYLCALAVECAQAGFDEILLTDVSYPTVGKLDKIDYGAQNTDLSVSLSSFLTELRAALVDYQVKISIELPLQELLDTAPNTVPSSGQSLNAMAPLVDGIYAAAADAQGAQQLAKKVQAVNEKVFFVPIGDAKKLETESYYVPFGR